MKIIKLNNKNKKKRNNWSLQESGYDTMLEMGFGPYSTQKLAQELRFPLTLINGPYL
jgi:hypothetical protein